MKASRELNALVAEQVMGWQKIDRVKAGWGNGPQVWSTGEDPDVLNSSPTFQGFEPSAKIAHAWLVVEKMRTKGKHFLMMSPADTGTCQASFFSVPEDTSDGSGVVDAAPLAICLAALKACGRWR